MFAPGHLRRRRGNARQGPSAGPVDQIAEARGAIVTIVVEDVVLVFVSRVPRKKIGDVPFLLRGQPQPLDHHRAILGRVRIDGPLERLNREPVAVLSEQEFGNEPDGSERKRAVVVDEAGASFVILDQKRLVAELAERVVPGSESEQGNRELVASIGSQWGGGAEQHPDEDEQRNTHRRDQRSIARSLARPMGTVLSIAASDLGHDRSRSAIAARRPGK